MSKTKTTPPGGCEFCDSADGDEFKGSYKKDDKVQQNLKSQLIENFIKKHYKTR